MITPFCYDYQYKTESLYDSQFLGGTRYLVPGSTLVQWLINSSRNTGSTGSGVRMGYKTDYFLPVVDYQYMVDSRFY